MNGRLGALYIGEKQVGGFLDWRYAPNLITSIDDGDQTQKVQSWKITAWAHWVRREILPGTAVRIRLCADAGKAYWEAKGVLASAPTKMIETLVHLQIEILGSGELTGGMVDDEG